MCVGHFPPSGDEYFIAVLADQIRGFFFHGRCGSLPTFPFHHGAAQTIEYSKRFFVSCVPDDFYFSYLEVNRVRPTRKCSSKKKKMVVKLHVCLLPCSHLSANVES